jgi:serine/threonine-protein kinase
VRTLLSSKIVTRSRPVSPDDPTRVEGGSGGHRPAAAAAKIRSGGGASLLADNEDSGNVAQLKPASEPLPENERSFGRFTLLRRLAYGGMGEIFLAKQGGAGSLAVVSKLVVIKRILSHMKRDEKHRRMFLDEARLQALLNNPHIVQIHDMGEENGHVFLAMEHVHGPSWRTLVDRCRKNREWIPLAHVCAMVSQAAAGLSYAHNLVDVTGSPLRIVHRDINPHNILVTYDGEVKIIDFGIAKSELADGQTETGTIKGKFSYMSPEQSAAAPLDRRSDIFALGICLYELLTLENPFRRGNVVLSLEAIQKDDPTPLAKKRKDAAALQAVVDKCLAKDAEDRFNDASELATALGAVVENGVIPQANTGLGSWLRERFADDIAEHLHILEKTGSTNAVVARGSDPSSLPRRRPVTSKPDQTALGETVSVAGAFADLSGDPTSDPDIVFPVVTMEAPLPLSEEPAVAQERTSSTPPPYVTAPNAANANTLTALPKSMGFDLTKAGFDVVSIADAVEPATRRSRVPLVVAGLLLLLVAATAVAAFIVLDPADAKPLLTRTGLAGAAPAVDPATTASKPVEPPAPIPPTAPPTASATDVAKATTAGATATTGATTTGGTPSSAATTAGATTSSATTTTGVTTTGATSSATTATGATTTATSSATTTTGATTKADAATKTDVTSSTPKSDAHRADKTDHKATVATTTPAAKQAVANLTVISEGYLVRGARKVYAGEAALLSVDKDQGEPFSAKLKVRIDDAGNATLDVDSDPWAIVRVDGPGKGRTPLKSIALPAGRGADIELANPTAGKMTLTLKVTPAR